MSSVMILSKSVLGVDVKNLTNFTLYQANSVRDSGACMFKALGGGIFLYEGYGSFLSSKLTSLSVAGGRFIVHANDMSEQEEDDMMKAWNAEGFVLNIQFLIDDRIYTEELYLDNFYPCEYSSDFIAQVKEKADNVYDYVSGEELVKIYNSIYDAIPDWTNK